MRPESSFKPMLVAVLTAALFASAPTLAQDADRQSECAELEAACDADDSASLTVLFGLAGDPYSNNGIPVSTCLDTNLDSDQTQVHRAAVAYVEASVEEREYLDSVQTEYHRAVGAFVEASVEERVFDAMLWLRRALNMEVRWDNWYYNCALYSGRPLIESTLDEDLARQYRRFNPLGPYLPAADTLGSAG